METLFFLGGVLSDTHLTFAGQFVTFPTHENHQKLAQVFYAIADYPNVQKGNQLHSYCYQSSICKSTLFHKSETIPLPQCANDVTGGEVRGEESLGEKRG